MNERDLIDVLGKAFTAFAEAGYVLTGELSYVKPASLGLVSVDVAIVLAGLRGVGTVSLSAWSKEKEVGEVSYVRRDTGEVCDDCGSSDLKWAGACKVCNNCGRSGGCG